jgi:sterol-4alpha-carboxylate 3-dehydrogenase (decarboxylating)
LVNVTGTQNVIDGCIDAGVKKLVYTSSGGVIYNGESDIIAADERLPYPDTALDAYNETKVKGEKLVLQANGTDGLLTCAIRPAGIFGPGDRQMITGFHNVMLKGQTKFQIGYNTNLGDFTYVGNVAHAHLLAVDKLGTTYHNPSFSEPIESVDLSLGSHRIPTSDARPLGPNTSPTEADQLAARRFQDKSWVDPSDLRPVLRGRMDHFADQANSTDEHGGIEVAGQSFFITNGEPIYFWDFARTIWKQLGHVPPYTIAMPVAIGLLLATLAEFFSKITGKEPGFTRFRVSQATQNRYYDIEKARRLLGYEPIVGLNDGMKRWTEWYSGELAKQGQAAESEKTK